MGARKLMLMVEFEGKVTKELQWIIIHGESGCEGTSTEQDRMGKVPIKLKKML
jgi:hypothetical protein